MRVPILIKIIWWLFLALLWVAGWKTPSDWTAATVMLQFIDYWIYSHASHPSLFALALGLTIGTVIIPEAWKLTRNHWFPYKPEPDISANEAFELILIRSKWATNQRKNWRKLPATMYEKDRPESETIENRLESAFRIEIHRLLRAGKIQTWGEHSPSRAAGDLTPERPIESNEWDDIRIEFEQSWPRKALTRGIALRNRDFINGSLAYVRLRFNRRQIQAVFPLCWFRKGNLR